MSVPLRDFLAQLAVDPAFYESYLKDRDKVMSEAGLSSADQKALLSGKAKELTDRLGNGSESDFPINHHVQYTAFPTWPSP